MRQPDAGHMTSISLCMRPSTNLSYQTPPAPFLSTASMSEDLLTGEAFGHLSSCKHRGVFADATVRALVEDAEAGCFKCIVLT